MPKVVTQNQILYRFIEKHRDKYDYSAMRYKEMRKNVVIICKEHGPFLQLPKVHLAGSGCPDCAVTGFNPHAPAILYYLKHKKSTYYKSGITNRTLRARFNCRLDEFVVLSEEHFDLGANAAKKEQKILQEHKEYRVTLDSFLGNGGTEFFSKDVRNLDTIER